MHDGDSLFLLLKVYLVVKLNLLMYFFAVDVVESILNDSKRSSHLLDRFKKSVFLIKFLHSVNIIFLYAKTVDLKCSPALYMQKVPFSKKVQFICSFDFIAKYATYLFLFLKYGV